MQSDTRSFIVRIWHEALNSDGTIRTWRGSIEHVGNGQRLHFHDLERVVDFIREKARLKTEFVAPGSDRNEPGSGEQGDPPE
jgi:hypothetical protein